jgi:hypothetical protein
MGFLSRKLAEQQPVPPAQPASAIVCRYCQMQIPASVAHGDFCSRLCKKRWAAEWESLQKLNREYASADQGQRV